MKFLQGKKTYVLAFAGGLGTAAHLAGMIDTETWTGLMGLLGFGAAASLRAGFANRR